MLIFGARDMGRGVSEQIKNKTKKNGEAKPKVKGFGGGERQGGSEGQQKRALRLLFYFS